VAWTPAFADSLPSPGFRCPRPNSSLVRLEGLKLQATPWSGTLCAIFERTLTSIASRSSSARATDTAATYGATMMTHIGAGTL